MKINHECFSDNLVYLTFMKCGLFPERENRQMKPNNNFRAILL